MDCIFCKIINKEIPSRTIYEDEYVKVFLDLSPVTNGHMLIVPKKHIVVIDEIDNDLMSHILDVEKKMYKLLKEKLNAIGLTIINNNDYGQEVKHLHIHLIPRYNNDGVRTNRENTLLTDLGEIYNILK